MTGALIFLGGMVGFLLGLIVMAAACGGRCQCAACVEHDLGAP